VQHPQPNTLRLSFPSIDERRIARGIETLADLLKVEFRKRQRGVRSELTSRVALI
jgi:DNA-binding transcriptional MocR family regulator